MSNVTQANPASITQYLNPRVHSTSLHSLSDYLLLCEVGLRPHHLHNRIAVMEPAEEKIALDTHSLELLEDGKFEKSRDSSSTERSSLESLLAIEDKRLLLDAETVQQADKNIGYEHVVSTHIKLVLLALYLILNLALTLSTKAIFQHLKAPWLLTALHSTFAAVGCNVVMKWRGQTFTQLSRRDNLIIVAFSTLFTVNIAVSNVSLSMVSVPFHQTVRAAGPVVTVLLYRVIFGRKYSFWTQLSLIPLVLGVVMLTYGNYSFTTAGFVLTFLGVLLASTKTITTNKILTGSRALSPIEVLARMSPLAAVQSLVLGLVDGEQHTILSKASEGGFTCDIIVLVAVNGILALLLNISSLYVNKFAGALAQTVSGNVKQCLTILLAIVLFDSHIGLLEGLGMTTTLIAAALFSFVELRARA
ncbi:TPT-domain-containing protein [Myriangium duriaei CBS 260.36]|uniref:TPT-domain-containing protein n=1 Tax=Myriangium duriaei CBS 260.36 TaxID=1168546 RepID=A0A9P4MLX6_9PEZI|nr:TPT-domain-containing protein [Myriangium duriaei CBS 260.36]